MADQILEKVDLSAIKAIAHDGSTLQVLVERDGDYRIESLPAPRQAFQGLLQLARFATLTKVSSSGATAREQLLAEIKMLPVKSSNIAAIGYSDVCQVLQVDFNRGSRYRYFNVPSGVFEAFLAAPSKGKFLNSVVKTEYNDAYQQIL